MLLITVLLAYVAGQEQTCNKYLCKPNSMQFSLSTCAFPLKSSVYLNPCTNSYYCPAFTGRNSSCTMIPPPQKIPAWPGEPCTYNSDCQSNLCQNKTCIGKHWLQSCNSTSECHVGLYCLNNSVCWFQKDFNQTCTSDYDCNNNLGCYIHQDHDTGRCRDYYSFEKVEFVYDCFEFKSRFCQSGNCASPGGLGICIDGIKPRYLESKCDSDEDCAGESYNWQFKSQCQCGFNENGQKYCQPFLGDFVGKKYMDALKEWYASSTIKQCHTQRRLDTACLSQWKNYKEYLKAYYMYENYAQLQQNDECVKEIYTDYYWGIV